jgi:hypothetical protein
MKAEEPTNWSGRFKGEKNLIHPPSYGHQTPVLLSSSRKTLAILITLWEATQFAIYIFTATAVELLMMGVRTSETCWAIHKRQVINWRNFCIWLVDLFERIRSLHQILFGVVCSVILLNNTTIKTVNTNNRQRHVICFNYHTTVPGYKIMDDMRGKWKMCTTGQCTYKRKIEARSRNHCCHEKAIYIYDTFTMRVSVTLVTQHAKRITLLYWHMLPVWLYRIFPHYLINGTVFGK